MAEGPRRTAATVARRTVLAAARTRVGALAGAALRTSIGPRPNRLAVLTYHRIADEGEAPELYPGLVSATPAGFAMQMGQLARLRHPIGLDDVLAAWRGTRRLPRGAVLVTFDDAYTSVATHAWPVLRRLGIPAVLFVPTAFPGPHLRAPRFWWDRVHAAVLRTTRRGVVRTAVGPLTLDPDHATEAVSSLIVRLKTLPHEVLLTTVDDLVRELGTDPAPHAVLDWPALRALASEGLAIAAHTRTHPLLTRVPPDVARAEISGSVADLAREGLGGTPVLAYPSGAVDDATADVAAEAGIELAFSTRRGGVVIRRDDPRRLHRINVGARTPLALLDIEVTLALSGAFAHR